MRGDVKEFLERIQARGEAATLQEKREGFAFLSSHAGSSQSELLFEDSNFLARDGAVLRARLYNPEFAQRRVAFYFHGGGYVCGSLYTHHEGLRHLTEELEACVISVDYRLAPEFKFPTALNDAVDAVRHFALQLQPHSIFVMGDSAGGNLAAAVSFHFRDCDKPERVKIDGQVLLYPTLDATFQASSWREIEVQSIANEKASGEFNELYARSCADLKSPVFSPLLAEQFTGLPKCFAFAGSLDPASGDSKAYVDKIQVAGGLANYREFPGMIHGFFNMTLLFMEARELHRELRALLNSTDC